MLLLLLSLFFFLLLLLLLLHAPTDVCVPAALRRASRAPGLSPARRQIAPR